MTILVIQKQTEIAKTVEKSVPVNVTGSSYRTCRFRFRMKRTIDRFYNGVRLFNFFFFIPSDLYFPGKSLTVTFDPL